VRKAVEQRRRGRGSSRHSVGTLSYVYDRATRALAQRIADIQHDHQT
jgi:metal-responsive CopG/Arc/MetJ family transcriptional regulator